jgi:hypothetical protein
MLRQNYMLRQICPDPQLNAKEWDLEEKLQYSTRPHYMDVHRQPCVDQREVHRGTNQAEGWVGPPATKW